MHGYNDSLFCALFLFICDKAVANHPQAPGHPEADFGPDMQLEMIRIFTHFERFSHPEPQLSAM